MASSRPGSRLLFPLAVALLLLALPLGAWLFLRPPAAPPPAPVLPAPEAPRPVVLSLAEVSGEVEVRGADGTWRQAAPGERLVDAAAVRTAGGSSAVLRGEELYEVRLEAGTEVSVEELTASISRLLLERGMATANVHGDRHLFEVKARGSDAVARTDGGTFTVSNDGRGTVAVATLGGEVELRGGGRLVVVRAGQQSVVLPGSGPSEPAPIPSSLLLKVHWPSPSGPLRQKRLVVSGQAAPGTLVEVAGTPLQVGAEGTFSRPVPLQEGANTLQVRARAVGGTTETSTHEVTVDTTPPRVGLERGFWTE